jgi:anti-anti-sigma regulatory factor
MPWYVLACTTGGPFTGRCAGRVEDTRLLSRNPPQTSGGPSFSFRTGGCVGSLSLRELSFGGIAVLIADGVVDDDTVEEFEQALDGTVGGGWEPLVVDLTGCQLASAGLAALVRLHRSQERRPEATLLVATDVDLLWTLQVVGLTYWCQVFATLDAALESCSPVGLSLVGAPRD